MWKYYGQMRPPFAQPPGPGQESVWDYPRPPRVVADTRLVEVFHEGTLLARSQRTLRVLETASPPTFYLPPGDVRHEYLERAPGASLCEWKGAATYWSLRDDPDPDATPCGWSYDRPPPAFSGIKGFFSFYPGRLQCFVDGEPVQPQPGEFYGGWVTSEIVGPMKGAPGTSGW